MRITRRRPFHLLDRQLEVSFYTSNLAKFLQARMVFERSGLTLRHLKSRTDPYQEDYEAGKTELLKRAIAQVQLRIGHDTPFFVEDTSLRIEALSPGRADFPGLRVKEWFQQGGFEELDSRLRREGNDRSAVVKSDIALHLPGLDQPAFFHGETRGAVADSASVQTQPPRYPWLGSDTFNAWFIPEGAIRRLSDMDFEVSCEHDFRVRALVGLLECQGRSKIRPPWRRKTRPSGRGVAWLKAAVRRRVRMPERPRAGGLSCCVRGDSSRR